MDPGVGVVCEELHDRVGDVRRVGRGAPLVADRAEGSPAARARSAASDAAREVAPRRPNSHAVRATERGTGSLVEGLGGEPFTHELRAP
jgi:hypothetical protein